MTSKQRWILVLASMASFMVALDALVVATALTTIRSDLNASLETLEWTMNSYNLSFAVLLMTGAALGDRFGRRRVFMIGLGIFSVSSAACALSPNIAALITFRTLQGVGAAIALPLALTLISAGFSPERRGKALGLFSGVTGLATLSGPFIGGVVAEGLAWQWIFWINIPIGIAAMLLVLVRIDESHGPNRSSPMGSRRRWPARRSPRSSAPPSLWACQGARSLPPWPRRRRRSPPRSPSRRRIERSRVLPHDRNRVKL
jgi:MFS family permease